jgi:hypothetical protein
MRDTNLDPHMQLNNIDARLERFERQAVITLTSISAVFVILTVTAYSTLVIAAPL